VGAVDTGLCLGVGPNLQLNWSADMKLGRTEMKEHGHAICSLQQEKQSNRNGVLPSSTLSVRHNPSDIPCMQSLPLIARVTIQVFPSYLQKTS